MSNTRKYGHGLEEAPIENYDGFSEAMKNTPGNHPRDKDERQAKSDVERRRRDRIAAAGEPEEQGYEPGDPFWGIPGPEDNLPGGIRNDPDLEPTELPGAHVDGEDGDEEGERRIPGAPEFGRELGKGDVHGTWNDRLTPVRPRPALHSPQATPEGDPELYKQIRKPWKRDPEPERLPYKPSEPRPERDPKDDFSVVGVHEFFTGRNKR